MYLASRLKFILSGSSKNHPRLVEPNAAALAMDWSKAKTMSLRVLHMKPLASKMDNAQAQNKHTTPRGLACISLHG